PHRHDARDRTRRPGTSTCGESTTGRGPTAPARLRGHRALLFMSRSNTFSRLIAPKTKGPADPIATTRVIGRDARAHRRAANQRLRRPIARARLRGHRALVFSVRAAPFSDPDALKTRGPPDPIATTRVIGRDARAHRRAANQRLGEGPPLPRGSGVTGLSCLWLDRTRSRGLSRQKPKGPPTPSPRRACSDATTPGAHRRAANQRLRRPIARARLRGHRALVFSV